MFDILHRVGIASPVDQVYKALTTREGVAESKRYAHQW